MLYLLDGKNTLELKFIIREGDLLVKLTVPWDFMTCQGKDKTLLVGGL